MLVILLATAAAVMAGALLAPKTYSATAELSAMANPAAADGSTDDLTALRGTLAELASSRDVVREVQARLDVERGTDELRDAISGDPLDGTSLVAVTVEDRDPRVAAETANIVADVLPLYDPSDGAFLFTTSDAAQEPSTWSSPNLVLVAAGGLVLALLLASAGALVRERRRSTVDTARVAEEATTAPLLAHVTPPHDLTSLPALHPGTADADVFRHLRVALETETSGAPAPRVVVAGVTPGEVNVWLGANLAISLATAGRRVLLIDGRMRDRGADTQTSEPDTAGLYDVLQGVDLVDGLSPGPVKNLEVLPAGQGGDVLTGTLIETDFVRVMGEAEERFDVVVVLAPSLDASDDAQVMATGGSLVLALPEGEVSVNSLRDHAARVRSVGARLLGVVLVSRHHERLAA